MKILTTTLKSIIVAFLFSFLACSSGENTKFRVLTAGIAHESNTFIPHLTTLDGFNIRRESKALENQVWAKYLEEQGIEIIPGLHASSGPSGMVSKEAYESLRDEILEYMRTAGPLDGIFLDMHGAMHVEGYPDAQVDFIQQIRNLVGEKVVIAASFGGLLMRLTGDQRHLTSVLPDMRLYLLLKK